MSAKPPVTYVHSLVDVPGHAGAPYTYLSVMNPVDSCRVAGVLLFDSQVYATGAASLARSLKVFRITAHSGGTLIDASSINRFNTLHPDPVCTVRVGNPLVVTAGLPLQGVAPAISIGLGTGAPSPSAAQPHAGMSFLFHAGEGIAFRTDDADADVFWNLTYMWVEVG